MKEEIKKLKHEILDLEIDLKQKQERLAQLEGTSAWRLSLRNKSTLLAIIAAGLIIGGSVFYTRALNGEDAAKEAAIGQTGSGSVLVKADDDPFLGPKDAKVEVIEFSDYQCPFCRRFWNDALAQIRKDFIDAGQSVKFVYRDFPLSFHPMSRTTAEAAECADDQGKFWQLHDKIFEEQAKKGSGTIQYTAEELYGWAGDVGINVGELRSCVSSGTYKKEVENDIADGSAAGVSGTPTIFINGKRFVGAQPYATFKAAIESELN